MLIQAGITITTIFSDNGMLKSAQNATEKSKIAEAKTKVDLTMADWQVVKHTENKTFEKHLKDTFRPENVTPNGESFNVKVDGYTFTVKDNGKVVETTNIYAKLYTYKDGSGDVLELSSNRDFEDTSENVTLKQDYGNIGANKYYVDYSERYVEDNGVIEVYVEETGLMPPWLEKKTIIDEGEGYKNTYVFYNPNEDITSVKIVDEIEPVYMEWWFYNLTALKEIKNISNINTSNVTDMSGMFWGCEALTTLDLSSFDTSNVTNMYGMFYDCSNLTTIYVGPKWTTDSAMVEQMFKSCGTDHVSLKEG